MDVRRSIVVLFVILLTTVSVAGVGAGWKWKKSGASEAGWTWDERAQATIWVD